MKGSAAAGTPEGWVAAVAAMMLLQGVSAFLNASIPTLAPILTLELGWPSTMVGYLVAFSMAGAIVFLCSGSPLVRGAGSIRAVQIGLLLGVAGVALLPLSFAAAPFVASVMIGLAYGPATPAGSDVLMRYSPVRHRSLIFSLKQAGVPLGTAAAGLALPAVAAQFGWHAALIAIMAVLAGTVLLVQTVRPRVDATRDPSQLRLDLFLSLANVRQPFAALAAGPGLRRIALAGGFLAMTQGAWNAFLMTYLVVALQYPPVRAGIVLAAMHATGAVGRIALGWLADRVGSGLVVTRLAAATSALTTLALGLARPDWPFVAVLAIAMAGGVTVSGWNGVQLAEIARRAPRRLVGEASAGGTVFVFMGFVTGPTLFATLLASTGRYDVACFAIAAMPVLALAAVGRLRGG